MIQVVSSGDLTFAIKETDEDEAVAFPSVRQTMTDDGYICMSTPAFAATLVILLAILVISCLLSAFLCLRHRSYYGESSLIAAFANPVFAHKKGHFSTLFLHTSKALKNLYTSPSNVDHVLFCIHDLSNEFLSVKFLKSLNNNPPHTSEVLPHWTKTTEYQPTESDSLPMII